MGVEKRGITLYDSSGNELTVQNGVAIPASTPGVMACGTDGTNARYISVDSTGKLNTTGSVVPVDGTKATYSAASATFSTAASATDIATLTGSSSKTIRVVKVEVTAIQTTASIVTVTLLKRSTANSSGTSSSITATPHDSNSAAASATALSYTANPTTGTLVGNLVNRRMLVPASATTADSAMFLVYQSIYPAQSIVLRGTGQVLAVNLGGTTISGGSFTVGFTWTEE